MESLNNPYPSIYDEVRHALENTVNISIKRSILFGNTTMVVSPGMTDVRFRVYKRIRISDYTSYSDELEEHMRKNIPLWDLQIRFSEAKDHQERADQAISIMVPRFQKVIE
jgi:hypothetical protein